MSTMTAARTAPGRQRSRPGRDTALRFELLGGACIRTAERVHPVRGVVSRGVLTVLLIERDTRVLLEDIVDRCWIDPPVTADQMVRNALNKLRGALVENAARPCGVDIAYEYGAYRLLRGTSDLDVEHLEAVLDDVHGRLAARERTRALELLGGVLGSTRGRLAPGLPDTEFFATWQRDLEDDAAYVHRTWVALRLLGPRDCRPPLEEARALALRAPYDDISTGLLMAALHLAGRAADARAALSRMLRDAGRPAPAAVTRLQELQGHVLRDDPAATRAWVDQHALSPR